jgi:hypothetical protein
VGKESVHVLLATVWFSFMTMPDSKRRSRLGKLPQNFYLQMLENPLWSPDLAPRDFHLFPPWRSTFQDAVSPTMKMSSCTITWLLITRCHECFNRKKDYDEKQRTGHIFIMYCQFPLLKSCLWFICTVNLISDPRSYYKGHGKRTGEVNSAFESYEYNLQAQAYWNVTVC